MTRKGVCSSTSLDFHIYIGKATPAAEARSMANMAATCRLR